MRDGTKVQRTARAAGCFYVLVFGNAAAFAIRSSLVVRNDAAATVANIRGAEPLFRLALVADLAATAAYVAVIALLYALLRPAGRDAARIAAGLGLVGCAGMAANAINLLASLVLVSGVGGMPVEQAPSLALLALRTQALGFVLCNGFFGLYCLMIGRLIVRSTFLPSLIGHLLVVAGLCYIANSLAIFLTPDFPPVWSMLLLSPGLLGEGGLLIWLILRGVDERAWLSQAEAADIRLG